MFIKQASIPPPTQTFQSWCNHPGTTVITTALGPKHLRNVNTTALSTRLCYENIVTPALKTGDENDAACPRSIESTAQAQPTLRALPRQPFPLPALRGCKEKARSALPINMPFIFSTPTPVKLETCNKSKIIGM